MKKNNLTNKLGGSSNGNGEPIESEWLLIFDNQGIKVIYNASQLRFYKQLQAKNDFEILTFLFNVAMSTTHSFSFFSFQGELYQSEKLNKKIKLQNNEITHLYNLFKRQNEIQHNIFLEYSLIDFTSFSKKIEDFSKKIEDILENICEDINKMDQKLTKYKNLIAKLKIDQNNQLFNQLIDGFIKEIQEFD